MYFKFVFSFFTCFTLSLCAASNETGKSVEKQVVQAESSKPNAPKNVAAMAASSYSGSLYFDYPGGPVVCSPDRKRDSDRSICDWNDFPCGAH